MTEADLAAYRASMSEAQLAEAIYGLAHAYGWLFVHFRPARTAKGYRTSFTGDEGFPDVVLVKPPRVLFLELKAERGRIRPMQQVWGAALEQCPGVIYRVCRPNGLDELAEMLAGGGLT